MTDYVPEPNEKVIINGGLIAVIDSVNVEGNLVMFHTESPECRYTEHLSHTRIEPLVPKVEQPELPFDKGKASDK